MPKTVREPQWSRATHLSESSNHPHTSAAFDVNDARRTLYWTRLLFIGDPSFTSISLKTCQRCGQASSFPFLYIFHSESCQGHSTSTYLLGYYYQDVTEMNLHKLFIASFPHSIPDMYTNHPIFCMPIKTPSRLFLDACHACSSDLVSRLRIKCRDKGMYACSMLMDRATLERL